MTLQVISIVISALSLCGVGTLFATMWKGIIQKNKEAKEKEQSLELGLQALLRAQMIEMYNHAKEKGYARIYEKENFENCYVQYHKLGANGVMTQIHDEYMAMSTGDK